VDYQNDVIGVVFRHRFARGHARKKWSPRADQGGQMWTTLRLHGLEVK
jgi:hypothetical protein